MYIKLPKRSDTIYKEIEEFEDYEYTNCITYEMAVRNESVKKLNEERDNILSKLLKEYDENLNECFTNIVRILQSEFYFLEEYLSIDDLRNEDNYTYETPMRIQIGKSKDGLMFKSIGEKDTTIDIPKGISVINCFKRPNLELPKEISRNIILQINPNLPKDELIAYISKIKDEYDKDNSIIKSPLELLGEVLEKSNNKKINKKLIADKFFIYDYVTARQEQIKKGNELKFQEYEEQLQEIKNNPYVTPKDRKIQQQELKKEFEENTNTRINELFEDIEDFTPATAKRYYYDIKPFIDDCKYKELITGTSSK